MIVHTPTTEAQACAVVKSVIDTRVPLTLRGGGTRAGLGRPAQAASTLSSAGLTGVTLYEPAEMVIAARAGTALSLVQETLAERGQMLPFEPMDHRSLYGTEGEPTIGAVAACNISGPRRINAGAARDSLIGLRLVNGRGDLIKSGGRVMKNVTGLDLVKLVGGSHGTLGFLTEVTFRVLPRPAGIATLQWRGLSDAQGVALLSKALGSPFEPMAAAHLPGGFAGEEAVTLLRLENFPDSIEYRSGELALLLGEYGVPDRLDGEGMAALWRDIRDAAFFAGTSEAIWRLSLRPTDGPKAAAIGRMLPGARWFYDWGGGLVWLAVPAEGDAGAAAVRAALKPLGGHATLVRAPDAVRAAVDVFQPLAEPLMRVTAGIKASFDPAGIFEPGRMYAGI
ncbi:Glycolate dehydrogenase, FAD-binding subunit GlcE [Hyphomicrobiales bacterium]|nr:Glycolate dehydrogenase, FAD-binding subunit GlcE [Hyphomicrobiales bacterium]CAH1700809.1 Glycolate dehydrogenase, FAD-binding subunit GlcE [Hyphomicrobiales bacterium]CAI0344684.1 glycolate oxidase FAD binding subunit [Hyphomicrobiales bacterium]